jgi:antitoxin MazE
MKTSVQKWGNSLAVRIPKAFAEGLGWKEDAPVEMAVDGDLLVVKTDRERTWDLDALLAGVTADNVHPAWVDGSAGAAGTAGLKEGGR